MEYDYNCHTFFHNTTTLQPFDDEENDDDSIELESYGSTDEEDVSGTRENQGTIELEEGEIDQNSNSEPMNIGEVALVGDEDIENIDEALKLVDPSLSQGIHYKSNDMHHIIPSPTTSSLAICFLFFLIFRLKLKKAKVIT